MTAWWVALAVLALNDHVLKGAGVLPGWLTGKLSDFAGMIVAPVLLAMMVRARRPVVRCSCFALVAALFSATKLWPAAARVVVAGVGLVGIQWRLLSDPTDLVALAALPFAWRLSTGVADSPLTGPAVLARPHNLRDPIAVALGAAACFATSTVDDTYRMSAFLANTTLETVTVQIYRARPPLRCAALATDAAIALGAADFEAESCWRLASGALVPLSRDFTHVIDHKVVTGVESEPPPCDVVVLRVNSKLETLLSWQQIGEVPIDLFSVNPRFDYALDPHGIYVERLQDRIFAQGSSLIASQPVTYDLPEITDCKDVPVAGVDGGAP